MKDAAGWAELHVESLWASLYNALPVNSPARKDFPRLAPERYDPRRTSPEPPSFRMYGPFLRQRKAIGNLLTVLRLSDGSNPAAMTNRADVKPESGVAYYEAESKELAGIYRVKLERTGAGAFDPRSSEYGYSARVEVYDGGRWVAPKPLGVPAEGPDPVALLLDLIRRDKGW